MTDAGLPQLDDQGLLPPGVHDLTIEQIEELFGRFQRSDRRPRLFRKLREYVEELRFSGWQVQVIVNGSFVMGCVNEPDDIDLVVVLPKGWNTATMLRPFEYNLLSKKRTRKRFGFDVFVVRQSSREHKKMLRFFGGIADKWHDEFGLSYRSKKGLARIVL
jgi:hypothetical protein